MINPVYIKLAPEEEKDRQEKMTAIYNDFSERLKLKYPRFKLQDWNLNAKYHELENDLAVSHNSFTFSLTNQCISTLRHINKNLSIDLILVGFVLAMELGAKNRDFLYATYIFFETGKKNKEFCLSIAQYYLDRNYDISKRLEKNPLSIYLSQKIQRNPDLAVITLRETASNLCTEFTADKVEYNLELANSLMDELNKLAVEPDNVDYLVAKTNIYW